MSDLDNIHVSSVAAFQVLVDIGDVLGDEKDRSLADLRQVALQVSCTITTLLKGDLDPCTISKDAFRTALYGVLSTQLLINYEILDDPMRVIGDASVRDYTSQPTHALLRSIPYYAVFLLTM